MCQPGFCLARLLGAVYLQGTAAVCCTADPGVGCQLPPAPPSPPVLLAAAVRCTPWPGFSCQLPPAPPSPSSRCMPAGHPVVSELSASADPAIVVPSNSAASDIFPMRCMVILHRVCPAAAADRFPRSPAASSSSLMRGLAAPITFWLCTCPTRTGLKVSGTSAQSDRSHNGPTVQSFLRRAWGSMHRGAVPPVALMACRPQFSARTPGSNTTVSFLTTTRWFGSRHV